MILLLGIFLSCTEVMTSTRFQSLLLDPTLVFQIHFLFFKCVLFGKNVNQLSYFAFSFLLLASFSVIPDSFVCWFSSTSPFVFTVAKRVTFCRCVYMNVCTCSSTFENPRGD